MKARFYIDVEFSGRNSDAETMATALDRVITTGMSALGDCWEVYGGKPKVGEFFVLDAAQAAEHAKALDLLINGQEDNELGGMLAPTRDFLQRLGKIG